MVIDKLTSVRVEYERIRHDHAFLRQVVEKGKVVAGAKARQTMARQCSYNASCRHSHALDCLSNHLRHTLYLLPNLSGDSHNV